MEGSEKHPSGYKQASFILEWKSAPLIMLPSNLEIKLLELLGLVQLSNKKIRQLKMEKGFG